MELAALQRELARRAVGAPVAATYSPALPPPEQLERFAAGLVRKRGGEVRRLLPRTAATLGERFGGLFQAFAAGRATEGPLRHQRDAVAFAAWLGRLADPSTASAAETARYESGWIEMRLGRRLLLRRFREGVVNPATNLPAPPGSGRWTIVLWLRGRRGRIHAFEWPPRRPALRDR